MEDASLLRFCKVELEIFSLETRFEISMNTIEGNLIVKLVESEFYEALYTNKSLYSKIGREGCIIMDFVYNLRGSKWNVFWCAQLQDNQDPETVDMCSFLGFCLPEIWKCPRAIDGIVKIYREGDLKNRVAKHRSNIFYDFQGRAHQKYNVLKQSSW